MKILFVAPASELQTSNELARVANGHEITICDGNVDRTKLELFLGRAQYDSVHFAGHGTRGVLELSDGSLDLADLISMMTSQTRLRFVILNACHSAAVGIGLHNALHIPIVAHDAPIDDAAAVRFSETFYRAYKSTLGDINTTFDRARATLQRLFPADARTPQLINGDMANKEMLDSCLADLRGEMAEAFAQINERMGRLEDAVNTLGGSRGQRTQTLIVILLAILTVLQALTPILNGMLVR